MPREIHTASDVIDELGGTAATARLTKKSIQAVSNWRATGRLPAETFLILTKELSESNLKASPSLWGIVEVGQ